MSFKEEVKDCVAEELLCYFVTDKLKRSQVIEKTL